MTLKTLPLTPAIGAVVEGIDLRGPLSENDIAEIAAALDDRLVIFFENQPLTPVEQRDLAARFGPLYRHPFYPGHQDAPEIMVLEHDATRRANADRWHNDVTYLARPPKAAVLCTEDIPPLGGDTLWANMYLAYETLSNPMKEFVGRLRAVHSFAKNFTPERFTALGMEDRRDDESVDGPESPLHQSRLHIAHRGFVATRERRIAASSVRAHERA